MIDNSSILSQLNLYAKLSELHDENPFKYKSFSTAAFNLKKIKEPFAEMDLQDLLNIQGVGKSALNAIELIIQTGTFPALEACLEKTPRGIVEMLNIKGLGPKKVKVIWEEMQINSVSDLLDACRQNRLVETKGFGIKTQADIIKAIEFSLTSQGKWHYARLMDKCNNFKSELKSIFPGFMVEYSGEFRRCLPIINRLLCVTTIDLMELYEYLEGESIECSVNDDEISFLFEEQVPFVFLCTDSMSFEKVLFETTGSEEHLKKIDYQPNEFDIAGSEEAYYESKNIPYIIPEQREGRDELVYNIDSQHFVEYGQLKGVLHNHTNYSDGLNTLKEMADYAKSQHFQYLGICDHSKSAGYARGLDEDRVLQQMREIDDLNSKMAPFKIFKGIESDILSDGSLDYDDSFLSKFDIVVASIHSNLNMSEEKAHERLIKAIENPYTTILGHLTGRLLLMRSGYPVNHEYIIDACAANHVCIELNAHPYRLDMDWTWIQYAQNKGVLISINPDAHEKMGYHDMYFGTIAARKGGLLTKNTLNAYTLVDFENYLLNRRKIKQL